MASSTTRTRSKRVRYTIDPAFGSELEKTEFSERLNVVRDLLTPPGSARLDNQALMRALFDCAQKQHTAQARSSGTALPQPSRATFLDNAGMYICVTYAFHKNC